ncbi:MAG: hypothetical protein SXU28_14055 [Pseudomonadota bacterium]|nr:hypothetical protein [Pseudomonadota bacterium]
MKPVNDWQIEQRSDSCVISRSFGDRTNPAKLELRQIDPWKGGFHVAVSGGKYEFSADRFEAGWIPGGRFITVEKPMIEKAAAGSPMVAFQFDLMDAAAPEPGSKAAQAYEEKGGTETFRGALSGLVINGAFERPLVLATGPMNAIMQKRDDCMKKMLASKGIEPADADRETMRLDMSNKVGLARHIFRKAPASMVSPTSRYASFLLYVDEKAGISDCRLATLPYDAEYEKFGCDTIAERGKLKFAKGVKAQPSFFKVSGRISARTGP